MDAGTLHGASLLRMDRQLCFRLEGPPRRLAPHALRSEADAWNASFFGISARLTCFSGVLRLYRRHSHTTEYRCVAVRKSRRGEEALRWSIDILTAMSQLQPIVEPAVEAAGYRLARLRLIGGKKKKLQIMGGGAGGTKG